MICLIPISSALMQSLEALNETCTLTRIVDMLLLVGEVHKAPLLEYQRQTISYYIEKMDKLSDVL